MAESTDIFPLKDKFAFLGNEEKGHRRILEKIFKKKFPDQEISMPEESSMPFPKFEVGYKMQLSEIIQKAMEAEKFATDFYKEMEKKVDEEDEKAIARYLSSMEESHYYLLKK